MKKVIKLTFITTLFFMMYTGTAYSDDGCDIEPASPVNANWCKITPPNGFRVRVFQFDELYFSPIWDDSGWQCVIGKFDSKNCHVATPPWSSAAFIHEGKHLYYTPARGCTKGTYDGANCYLGALPTSSFIYNDSLYYRPTGGADRCPVKGLGKTWDGANCYVGHESRAFVYSNNLYLKPDVCGGRGGSFDGSNCYVGTKPSGTHAFVYDNKLYTTPSCTVGGVYKDGSCYLGKTVNGGYEQNGSYFYPRN